MKKICAIIPAFNEAEAISAVVKGVISQGIDALVVNDGSTDNTALIAQNRGAFVISHKERRGKGIALKTGLDKAVSDNYKLLFILDADGQHDPNDIPVFLKKLELSGCSAVIGNRMGMPKGMPFVRVLTNKFMSSVISLICCQHIPDSQCGYRLFTREVIANVNIKSQKFEIESEILIKLSNKGFRIESVPIKTIYANEKSKIRPIRDTIRFIRLIIKVFLKGNAR